MKKRILSVLLALALLLSLVGCQQEPVETQPPTTETTAPPETTVPEPTAPDGTEAYAAAREALEEMSEVSLDITYSTAMTVENEVFYTNSQQVLTYAEADAVMIALEEKLTYGEPDEEEEEAEEEPLSYSEIWADGTLYTEMEETYFFSASLAQEEALDRYVPVALLDESLYGDVTSRLDGKKVLVTFAGATAGETWAVPEDAQLMEAKGEALIDESGKLEKMSYTATYSYGPAEYTVEVESAPRKEAAEVSVPENADAYLLLQYPDALQSYMVANGLMFQSDAITLSGMESVFCQAAGVLRNQSVAMDLYGRDEDFATKVEQNIFFMDYGTGEEVKMKQEEVYRDGKYVATVDDGVPTYLDLALEDMEYYCTNIMLAYIGDPVFWTEATVEDLGSAYLVSYTMSEDFGKTVQNSICEMFWEDAAFLNKLASAYANKDLTGYLAFEKYTGIPTAAGFYYEGAHTIDGVEYTLSLQADQAMMVPSFGAYHEITEEWLPETEPENKATPLFYHVTGENGQEMWLLGTIHVGDERTGFLPQEIYDAFAASDALALECDTEAFDEKVEADEKLQEKVSDLYYYSNGKTAADYLDEETYELAVKYMKASGSYNMNTPYMKLSLWSSSIDNFVKQTGHLLTDEQGVEERLTKLAHEQEKKILEVESNLFQQEMLTGWSDDLQVLLLEESMETAPEESWQGLAELYDLWCAGDEEAMRKELSDEVDLSELTEEELAEYEQYKHLLEEYNKAMSYDRNDGMLEVAIEYLESGEVVFYAVGLAHLLNNVNGLVDTLREAGYTVELVTYG